MQTKLYQMELIQDKIDALQGEYSIYERVEGRELLACKQSPWKFRGMKRSGPFCEWVTRVLYLRVSGTSTPSSHIHVTLEVVGIIYRYHSPESSLSKFL